MPGGSKENIVTEQALAVFVKILAIPRTPALWRGLMGLGLASLAQGVMAPHLGWCGFLYICLYWGYILRGVI